MREMQQLNSSVERKDSLVRLEGIPINTTKPSIRIFAAHFATPEYIDYKRGSSYATIRFGSSEAANKFVEGCLDKEKTAVLGMPGAIASKLTKDEESDYLLLVQKHKQSFKEYKAARKRRKLE